jgi:hypothetical protein
MLPIKYLTIHCTATPEGRANTAREVMQWDTERFGQPSYHWVIELDGTAVRCLQDHVRGAHVAGHNSGNIGVAYVGGTETLNAGGKPKDTRTPEQKAALKRLVEEYREKYTGLIVRGHREWPEVHKACPSFSVHDWLAAGMP